jgi:hypothetical protein
MDKDEENEEARQEEYCFSPQAGFFRLTVTFKWETL